VVSADEVDEDMVITYAYFTDQILKERHQIHHYKISNKGTVAGQAPSLTQIGGVSGSVQKINYIGQSYEFVVV